MFRVLTVLVLSSFAAFAGDSSTAGDSSALSSRWLQLDTVVLGFRYATEQASGTGYTAHQWQQQQIFGGSFKFDEQGKYTIQTLVATGNVFNGGWNNTAAGNGAANNRPYWKQFYFDAKPVSGLELQYGGIGVSSPISDIVGYSGEGYFTGSRLIVRRPKQFFFDEFSATYAYLGDLSSPDMTDRFRRLGKGNFQQYEVQKQAGRAIETSLQYTNQWGIKTLSEGVKVAVHRSRVFDHARLDVYERVNGRTANGFHAGVDRNLFGKATALAGYGSVDRFFGDLNADAFLHGNRFYFGGSVPLGSSLSFSCIYNRGAFNNYDLGNRTHVHLGVNWDVLKTIQRARNI